MILICFLISLTLILASCSYNQASDNKMTTTKKESTTTTSAPIDPTTPPTQPLSFDSTDDAISFLKTKDYSYTDYPSVDDDEDKNKYNYMIDIFNNSGYLYEIANEKEQYQISRIAVLPEANLEDVGILFWVEYNDAAYCIVIYNARSDIEINEEDPSIQEYYKSRFDLELKGNEVNVNSEFFSELNIQTVNYCSVFHYARGFIDPTHYVSVKTTESEEKLIEFMEQIKLVRIELL